MSVSVRAFIFRMEMGEKISASTVVAGNCACLHRVAAEFKQDILAFLDGLAQLRIFLVRREIVSGVQVAPCVSLKR